MLAAEDHAGAVDFLGTAAALAAPPAPTPLRAPLRAPDQNDSTPKDFSSPRSNSSSAAGCPWPPAASLLPLAAALLLRGANLRLRLPMPLEPRRALMDSEPGSASSDVSNVRAADSTADAEEAAAAAGSGAGGGAAAGGEGSGSADEAATLGIDRDAALPVGRRPLLAAAACSKGSPLATDDAGGAVELEKGFSAGWRDRSFASTGREDAAATPAVVGGGATFFFSDTKDCASCFAETMPFESSSSSESASEAARRALASIAEAAAENEGAGCAGTAAGVGTGIAAFGVGTDAAAEVSLLGAAGSLARVLLARFSMPAMAAATPVAPADGCGGSVVGSAFCCGCGCGNARTGWRAD